MAFDNPVGQIAVNEKSLLSQYDLFVVVEDMIAFENNSVLLIKRGVNIYKGIAGYINPPA
jgi:hypothetical protein